MCVCMFAEGGWLEKHFSSATSQFRIGYAARGGCLRGEVDLYTRTIILRSDRYINERGVNILMLTYFILSSLISTYTYEFLMTFQRVYV